MSSISVCAGSMQLVESIPLLPNSKANKFVGVNMYVDDTGSIKQLPVNVRASDICSCCGHRVQVRARASHSSCAPLCPVLQRGCFVVHHAFCCMLIL